jgi:hypothetical protein
MANPPGALNLDALDDRFVDSLRDTTVVSATRYRYLEDAYSRVWYMYHWDFRKTQASLSVSAGVSEYAVDEQCDLLVAAFNNTENYYITMNKGFWNYWNNYNDNNRSGTPRDIVDFRSENGNNTIVLGQEPTTTAGSGAQIDYYYYKHLVHNNATGGTATGNMAASTDVPSFAPQFHPLIVKEALLEATKDKRQFAEFYQSTLKEKNDLLKLMKKRYCTPSRNNRQFRVQR